MKHFFVFISLITVSLIAACDSGSSSSTSTYVAMAAADNVQPISLICDTDYTYNNAPYTLVTISIPGSSATVTIDHVLVDTGSVGLRLLKSQVPTTMSFPTISCSDGGALCEGVSYGDGSATWGEVVLATVTISGETAASTPIQLIDDTYAMPSAVGTVNSSSQDSLGANGILGVGLETTDIDSGYYYSCPSTSTSSYTEQTYPFTGIPVVTNPVSLFPLDNNGVIIDLPPVSSSGALEAAGYLIFGIGTRSNNQPGSVTSFAADDYDNFTTVFNSTTMNESFIDSGSNALYFNDSSISYDSQGFYNPSSTLSLSAVNIGADKVSGTVSFSVGDADTMNGDDAVLPLLAAYSSDADQFDWGLPFFFNKEVYVVIRGSSSSLGSGPRWAY